MVAATIARKALTKGTQAARRAAAAAKKKAAKKAREAREAAKTAKKKTAKVAKKTSKKASQATRRATSSAKKRAKKTVGATKRAVKKANTEGIVLGGLAVEGANKATEAVTKPRRSTPSRNAPRMIDMVGTGDFTGARRRRREATRMKNGGNVKGRSKK
jgi:membrane protein involved in colicin uptake